MESLPCELLIKILMNLDLKGIFKSRCVNKRWRLSIDNNIRLKSLLISDTNLSKYDKSNLTHRPVDCFYWIKKFNFLQRKLKFSIFSNLRNLHVNTQSISSKNAPNFGRMVSNFKQLETLEIINLKINDEVCMINLPNLNELNLENIRFKAITLETANLTNLRVNYNYNNLIDLDRIKFNYPLSLIKLEIKSFQPKIKSFLNLQYLYCKEIEFIDSKFVKHMSNLKEIHFNQSIHQRENILSSLKQQTLKLKKRDLKIFNFGLNLSNLPDFRLDDGYSHVDSNTTQFFCDNYDKLATELPFIWGIDFSILSNCFVELPTDFASRFVNINSVLCKGNVDAKQFINFLKNYRNLKSLNLKWTSLKQNFFNILPYLCPNLINLTINQNDCDLNFILKFKNLTLVDTFQEIDLNILRKIFKKTKINQLFFGYQAQYMAIFHDKDVGIYRFSLASEEPDEFRSIKKIINILKNAFYADPYLEDEENYSEGDNQILVNQALNDQKQNRQVLNEQVLNRQIPNQQVLNEQKPNYQTPKKVNKIEKENKIEINVQANQLNQEKIEDKKENSKKEDKYEELDEELFLSDFDENDVNKIDDLDNSDESSVFDESDDSLIFELNYD